MNTPEKLIKKGVRLATSIGLFVSSIISPLDSPKEVKADSGQTIVRNGVELTLLHPDRWDQVQVDKRIGVSIYRQNNASLDLARRVARDYFFSAKPLDEFKDKFYFVDVNFPSGMPDFGCDQRPFCANQELIKTTGRNVKAATGFVFQERIVLIKSNSSGVGGASSAEQRFGPPSLDTDAQVVYPEQLIHDRQKSTIPHEIGTSILGFQRAEEPNSVANNHGSNDGGWSPDFGIQQTAFTRELLANYPLPARYNTPGLYLDVVPLSAAISQQDTKSFSDMDMVLSMVSPVGTTEIKWYVYSAPNIYTGKPDGPAIEMKYGDSILIHAVGDAGQVLRAPRMGEGNYVWV